MRIFGFIILLLFSVIMHGKVNYEGFGYSVSDQEIDPVKYSDLISILEFHGFFGLEKKPKEMIPFAFVNEIGINPFNLAQVLIKTEIALSDEKLINEIILLEFGTLVHLKVGSATVALFFTRFSVGDVKSIVHSYNSKMSLNFMLWNILNPQAIAAEGCRPSEGRKLIDTFKGTSISALTLGTLSCLNDKLKQLPTFFSNKDQFDQSQGNFVQSLIKDGVGFWDTAVAQARQLYSASVELPSTLSKLMADFPPIDDEIKAVLICQFISESGPTFLLGIVGGVGMAKFAASLVKWLKGFTSLAPMFAKFSQLGKQGNEVIKYLIKKRDELDSSMIAFFRDFDFKSHPSLLGKLSSCAL